MQHVMAVKWTSDNKYILSASDEMNIRIWKSYASEKLGLTRPREKEQFEYNEKLKEKFKYFPEIKRVRRHRHLPKTIFNAQKEKNLIKISKQRKEANKRTHSKPGLISFISEKKKTIVQEHE
jgi:WD repeat and SOF domain-containing protein 1